jgi:hypothetical protein
MSEVIPQGITKILPETTVGRREQIKFPVSFSGYNIY